MSPTSRIVAAHQASFCDEPGKSLTNYEEIGAMVDPTIYPTHGKVAAGTGKMRREGDKTALSSLISVRSLLHRQAMNFLPFFFFYY